MKKLIMLLCLAISGCQKWQSNESLTNLEKVLATAGNSACGKEGGFWNYEEGKWGSGDNLEIFFKCEGGVWKMRKFDFVTWDAKRADEVLAALRKKGTVTP